MTPRHWPGSYSFGKRFLAAFVLCAALAACAGGGEDRRSSDPAQESATAEEGAEARNGLIRERDFIHPGGGFMFTAPEGFALVNRTNEVAVIGPGGVVAIFDAAAHAAQGPDNSVISYLTEHWTKGKTIENLREISIAGRPAATGSYEGVVDGGAATVRLVAVRWSEGLVYRFQISIPHGTDAATVEELRRMTYSLRDFAPGNGAPFAQPGAE